MAKIDSDYTKEIEDAAKALRAALEKSTAALKAVGGVADLLLDQDAPKRLQERFATVVEEDTHLDGVDQSLNDLAELAKEAGGQLKATQKLTDKIRYASSKLYAQVRAKAAAVRAQAERERQAAAQRQQQMFGGGPSA